MKKIMMMAAAVVVSLAANAQTSPEAKAVKKLKTYAEVVEAIKASASAMTPEDQAFCYNKAAELASKESADAESDYVQAQIKKDEAAMTALSAKKAEAALNALTNAQKAFALNPKAVKIAGQLQSLRGELVNGGLDSFNSKKYDVAQSYFGTYVDAKTSPLFAKVDFSKEQGFGQIAYYAALSAYFNKDFKASSAYSDVAIANPDTTVISDAINLKINVLEEFAKTSQIDTAKFISEIKDVYAKFNDNDALFSKLYTLYEDSKDASAALNLANARLAADPTNAMANALKGQSAQNAKKYDEAIDAYKKALASKPDFIIAKLQLGQCYLIRAAECFDANADARGNVRADKKAEVKADADNAKKVFEELKAADPNREQVDWAYSLERAEYILERLQ